METPNTEMLRTRVDVFVLNAVSKNDGYGYDILNHIQTRTYGHYELKQSSVYNVLKRLEGQGYLRGYQGNETNGGKRRYYAITEKGKEYLDGEKTEWEYSRTLIDNLISDKVFDLQSQTRPFNPSALRPFTPRKPRTQEKPTQKIAALHAESDVGTLVDDAEDLPATNEKVENVAIDDNYASKEVLVEKEAVSIEKTAETILSPSPDLSYKSHSATVAATTSCATNNIAEKELNDSYKALFEEIFAAKEINEEINDVDTSIDCKHINDLRLLLNKEGHKVNTYAPSSNKNYMRYILTAKFNRDLSIISYLFFVVMLLAVYLAKDSFSIKGEVVLTLGCIGIIVPIVFIVQYFANPNKRKKDNVRLNIVLPICLVVYIAFLVLNIIIELLIPRGYSINSSQIYAPSIIALVIPFFGMIYAILYKSNLYHQKVK